VPIAHDIADTTPPTDEDLVAGLDAGGSEVLAELYARHASAVFAIAARALDAAAAEDVVQEVFLVVWRQAHTFDPARGSVRAWVIRIAQSRVANELRRRRRRPHGEGDPDGRIVESVPDERPGLPDTVWREFRRRSLRAALDALPPAQQRALGLAYFEDMTHEQIAAVLELPLGTVKTRIRAGVQRLRAWLPQVAAASLVVLVAALGLRQRTVRLAWERDERALALVTSSDTQDLRLGAVAGVARDTHARYRGRAGAPIAVVTLSHFTPAAAGRSYQLWALRGGAWSSLATVTSSRMPRSRRCPTGSGSRSSPRAAARSRAPTSSCSGPTAELHPVAWVICKDGVSSSPARRAGSARRSCGSWPRRVLV
jgi:RNA polymerase sigma-70 factor (ECF subfamily)